jgi:TonB family protein
MKTKKKFTLLANLKICIVLPLIAVAIIAFSSCGKNKTAEVEPSVIAPPPPPVPVPDSAYTKVDEMPVYNGGDTAILGFIARKTIYPAEAKTKAIQGRVVVKLVVEKDGSISRVAIIKGVDPLLDAEALKVVSTLPKFEKPGILNGKPVAVNYMIPITFTLK